MATEPEAKGNGARPGPLTPAARQRQRVWIPPPPSADQAWNLSDELCGLETDPAHVDVYAQPRVDRAVPRERPAARPAAALVPVAVVGLTVLLQLASVVSSFSASGGGASLSAEPSLTAVAPGGRIALEGDGAPAGAELVLETRRPGRAWLPLAEGRAGDDGRFRVEGRVLAAPGSMAVRVRAAGAAATAPVGVTVRPLRLASVGDVNLGDAPGAAIEAEGPRYPWESAGRTLRQADIAFGNLECAISKRGSPFPKQYTFRGTPAALAGLRRHAGIDVLNLANNHVGDYGSAALLDTVRNTERLGVRAVGAGPGLDRALRPQVVERLGLRVGFVGFSNILPLDFAAGPGEPGVAWATPEAVDQAVRAARRRADVVVATFHWGIEKAPYETAEQAELARVAADAGAQLVIGAHPHVLQPLRRTGSALVAYSLGNFVFGAQSSETAATGVLETDLSAEGVSAARWRPGRISGGRPVLDDRRPQRLAVDDPDAMAVGLTLRN
jgi:poly-gamma-glutamate capsule biosynthesis protein CapA/YwtB (metallophosphatase superfamily)